MRKFFPSVEVEELPGKTIAPGGAHCEDDTIVLRFTDGSLFIVEAQCDESIAFQCVGGRELNHDIQHSVGIIDDAEYELELAIERAEHQASILSQIDRLRADLAALERQREGANAKA